MNSIRLCSARSKMMKSPKRTAVLDGLEPRRLFSTFNVSTLLDVEDGSLRTALLRADFNPGADTITFDPGLSGTLLLEGGELIISDPAGVTIQGPGASVISISGGNTTRVFDIDPGAAATITGLTITNGRPSNNTGPGNIQSDGNLTLSNCVITLGSSNDILRVGGGLNATGITNINDCQFIDNGRLVHDGTIATSSAGAIANSGDMTILRSSFLDNGAQAQGGTIISNGKLTIIDSTISGGRVGAIAGGIYFGGQLGRASLRIVNSTITDNEKGAIVNFGNSTANDFISATIVNSTISGQTGAALVSQKPSSRFFVIQSTITQNATGISNTVGAQVVLANSIVSGNTNDFTGDWFSAGGNYLGGNALLGSFANHGGPTQTYVPARNSPAVDIGRTQYAIDPGPDGYLDTPDDLPLTTDQRGTGFARFKGPAVDAGAVEVTPAVGGSVVVDPTDPNRSVLMISGSGDDDTIAITRGSSNASVNVTGNGVLVGAFTFNGRIVIDGGDGVDTITIDPLVTRSVMIFGGAGADIITGGGGDDVIVGGDGADRITGGIGDDLLIGGADADQINGNAGDDILIGGQTIYDLHTDANAKALSQLIDAWGTTRFYLANVLLVGLGIGPSHPYKLNGSTVSDDGVQDALTGGAGQDWFLGNFIGAGAKDTTDRGFLEIALDA
jgi:Ca2+-binding RTX toxin-like protein